MTASAATSPHLTGMNHDIVAAWSRLLRRVIEAHRPKLESFDANDVDEPEFELIDVGSSAIDEMPEVRESRAFRRQHQIHTTVAQMTERRQAVGAKAASGKASRSKGLVKGQGIKCHLTRPK